MYVCIAEITNLNPLKCAPPTATSRQAMQDKYNDHPGNILLASSAAAAPTSGPDSGSGSGCGSGSGSVAVAVQEQEQEQQEQQQGSGSAPITAELIARVQPQAGDLFAKFYQVRDAPTSHAYSIPKGIESGTDAERLQGERERDRGRCGRERKKRENVLRGVAYVVCCL